MGIGIILENRKFNFDSKDPTNKWGFAGLISLGIGFKVMRKGILIVFIMFFFL